MDLLGVAFVAFFVGGVTAYAVSYWRWLNRQGLAVCYKCDRTTSPREDK